MNYTINLELQTYIPENKKIPLRFRVSINGKGGYITLGRKIEANQYNFKKKLIKTGIKGYTNIKNYLAEQEKILRNILQDAEIRGEILTHKKLKEKYNQQTGKATTKTIDLFEYIAEQIEYDRKFSKAENSTFGTYESSMKIAKKYKNKISIYEVDKTYIEKLVSFLSKCRHNKGESYSENTIYSILIVLRKYIKRLFDNGEIKTYPFKDYQIGSAPEVEYVFLTPDELARLHEIYEKGELGNLLIENKKVHVSKNGKLRRKNVIESYNNILKTFLISCYTGLRFSDTLLKKENVQGNYIVKEVKKGRLGKHKIVRIPVRHKLKSLMNYNAPDNNVFGLTPLNNSSTNTKLRVIAEVTGIDKYLHFHVGRHTFATISLMLGMRVEIIQDILGHSDPKMTLRYAHIVDKIRDREMNKWDEGLKNDGFADELNKEQIICPKCKNHVISFERGIIKLNKLPVECSYCGTEFLHSLSNDNKIKLRVG